MGEARTISNSETSETMIPSSGRKSLGLTLGRLLTRLSETIMRLLLELLLELVGILLGISDVLGFARNISTIGKTIGDIS